MRERETLDRETLEKPPRHVLAAARHDASEICCLTGLAPAGRDELQNLLQNVVEWPHKGGKVDDRSI